MDRPRARNQTAHSGTTWRLLPGKGNLQGSGCGAGAGVAIVSIAEESEGGDEEIEAWYGWLSFSLALIKSEGTNRSRTIRSDPRNVFERCNACAGYDRVAVIEHFEARLGLL